VAERQSYDSSDDDRLAHGKGPYLSLRTRDFFQPQLEGEHKSQDVDSRTTPHSVVPSVAKELGMPVLANDVFLDHEEDEKAMAMRLETASS
ncbi:divergent polysaccharide deacetylase family protein, partial [Acetomicrobium sp. S15 = DSM 107314]|uniref:divergent polysaccharide deacetylase family protein n=1 Tax=Acetomicrobium sp. S15 = DSM 107314 TaxID=2529858 RepID=UPI0018E1D250